MFFRYSPGDRTDPPPPRPVYARIDQVEPLDDVEGAHSLILLDCVDARWLDEIASSARHLSDAELSQADSRISIVSIFSKDLNFVEIDSLNNSDDYPGWFFLELGDPDEGSLAEQFHNLFQDPTERGVIKVRPVTDAEAAILKRLAGWHDIKASNRAEIEEALEVPCSVDGVAIYDVGHGAATALISVVGPALYFDVGGSAIGNWRSFPEPLRQFCTILQPPVVLSHWDWDHWSSALRDNKLMENCRWILPIQDRAGELGAVHARFLAMLKARGAKIYWWDYATPPISSSAGFTVFRTRGSAKSRNESGLALRVDQNNRTVVLPGDASLSSVRAGLGTGLPSLDYLMIPHHGGRSSLTSLPTPVSSSTSCIIYSYGVSNVYLHPLPKTVRAFRKSWKKSVHTALRDGSGLGHVGINLRELSVKRFRCASGRCQLGVRQWI